MSQEKQNPYSHHKDNKSSSSNNSKSSNKSKIPKSLDINTKYKKSPNNNQITNPVENQDQKEKDDSSTKMEYTINEQKTS